MIKNIAENPVATFVLTFILFFLSILILKTNVLISSRQLAIEDDLTKTKARLYALEAKQL